MMMLFREAAPAEGNGSLLPFRRSAGTASRLTPFAPPASREGFSMRFVPTLVHGIADYLVGIGMMKDGFLPW
ncbi:MAG TPA: hypothetical protein VFY63_18025 [Pseudorhizobium sp.]|nr:hypothetical protein [Pseudorhizobium sp.]